MSGASGSLVGTGAGRGCDVHAAAVANVEISYLGVSAEGFGGACCVASPVCAARGPEGPTELVCRDVSRRATPAVPVVVVSFR